MRIAAIPIGLGLGKGALDAVLSSTKLDGEFRGYRKFSNLTVRYKALSLSAMGHIFIISNSKYTGCTITSNSDKTLVAV